MRFHIAFCFLFLLPFPNIRFSSVNLILNTRVSILFFSSLLPYAFLIPLKSLKIYVLNSKYIHNT